MRSGRALPLFVSALTLLGAGGWTWKLPPGFPPPRVPASNPMTPEKRDLGRRLFYDARLSGNGIQSCASCHQPARAFTDGRPQAVGSTGQRHRRGSMSLANVAYSASLTWADPGQRSLEGQARVPMENEHPVEMGVRGHETEILARLRAEPVYADLFPRAFPGEREPLTLANVRKAIACFERTIVSGDSPYDRLLGADDRGAMPEPAMRGMRLFFSDRTRCSRCHEGFAFSGPAVWKGSGPRSSTPRFVSNGLPAGRDPGLYEVTRRQADRGRFRAPTLRNVAVTAPYMHDGRFATLGEVVDHYERGSAADNANHKHKRNRSPLVPGFTLTEQEKADLIAFLESLTDEGFLEDPGLSNPWISPSP